MHNFFTAMRKYVEQHCLPLYGIPGPDQPNERTARVKQLLQNHAYLFKDTEVHLSELVHVHDLQKQRRRFQHEAIIKGVIHMFFKYDPILSETKYILRRECEPMKIAIPASAVSWVCACVSLFIIAVLTIDPLDFETIPSRRKFCA